MGCGRLSELCRFEAGEGKTLVAQILKKNIIFHFIVAPHFKSKWDLKTRGLLINILQPYKLWSLLEACRYSTFGK